MIDSYLAIANSPLLWVFLIMVIAAFGIMWLTSLEVRRVDLNASWLRKNYVVILMGAATLLAVLALYFYLISIGLSLSGLVSRLRHDVGDPGTSPEDLSHLGTTVALLMGVLAAAATIFFSIIRVWINERTATAAEENLFNQKLSAAAENLHARREVTIHDHQTNIWEDDVSQRTIGVFMLERLAEEYPNKASLVAGILAQYVRSLPSSLSWEATND